nr:13209_t:CDS:2 [Entrophospora candida]
MSLQFMSSNNLTKDLYIDNDEECPICRNNRYLTPNMKLLVSECYHKMCESCIDRLFANGAGPCPICKQTLRKINFVVPTFEDLRVEKEIKIRKKLAHQFNKRQEDFDSLKGYNDYLEMVEDIAWDLINDTNKKETEAVIENYKNYKKELDEERRAKEAHEAEIIRELANSTAPASETIKTLAYKKSIAVSSSTSSTGKDFIPGLSQTSLEEYDSGIAINELIGFKNRKMPKEDTLQFVPLIDEYMDVDHYTLKDRYYDPYIETTTRLRSGGFSQKYIYKRSLEAAFSGLFSSIKSDDDYNMIIDQ